MVTYSPGKMQLVLKQAKVHRIKKLITLYDMPKAIVNVSETHDGIHHKGTPSNTTVLDFMVTTSNLTLYLPLVVIAHIFLNIS